MHSDEPTFGPLPETQAPVLTLAALERDYERWYRLWVVDRRDEDWERVEDLAKTIRSHCRAWGLVPGVDVGDLE